MFVTIGGECFGGGFYFILLWVLEFAGTACCFISNVGAACIGRDLVCNNQKSGGSVGLPLLPSPGFACLLVGRRGGVVCGLRNCDFLGGLLWVCVFVDGLGCGLRFLVGLVNFGLPSVVWFVV